MIYFLAIKGSSLMKGSFPVEIAWVDQDGNGATYLIKPADEWLNPADGAMQWCPKSEANHSITLTTLLEMGVSHVDVARKASAILGRLTVTVAADPELLVLRWFDMLFKAAGFRRSVAVITVDQLYAWACRPLRDTLPLADGPRRRFAELRIQSVGDAFIERAKDTEMQRPGFEQRALHDAQSLWRTWRIIRQEVAGHVKQSGPHD